ncbi:hypothetical protein L6R52_06605 [Myxococcota bacterium]|nr:hypothetical protein [Myxococcota bacterium]
MSTSLRLLTLLALFSCGCAVDVGGGGTSPLDWDEFLALSTREFEGRTIYVVDGDIPATLEDVRIEYDRLTLRHRMAARGEETGIATEVRPSTVNRTNYRDDLWDGANARSLRYCVSDEFGANKQRMIDEMSQAAGDWEAQAWVDFQYVPAEDASCTAANMNVTFAVRPWISGGACAFFPSGGGCVERTLVINVSDIDDYFAPVTTLGVFRHELGHVLGLRHEHVRALNTYCMEPDWRGVTAYDPASVMHYPWCPGATNAGDLTITPLDATGILTLYPRACATYDGCSSVPTSGVPTCMGSDMRCEILVHERLPTSTDVTVVVTGGGYSGSWSQAGYRCGTSETWSSYVEVYADDPDHTWSWPTACVLSGDTFTLEAGHTYSFRGPSFLDATPLPVTLAAFGPPTNLAATALAYNQVTTSWTDVWATKDGVRVERARRGLYTAPTPVLPIGVFGYYIDSTARATLDASASRFCTDRGFSGFASYGTYGPVSAAHSWWTGSAWQTTGNNTVMMMSDLDCTTGWSEVGVATGGTATSYVDGTASESTRYAYRVRSYRGSTFTDHGSAVVVTTPARPPLTAQLTLSGTTLIATASGGTSPYNYAFYKYLACARGDRQVEITSKDRASARTLPAPNDIHCNEWMLISSGPSNQTTYVSRYSYRVDVTDSAGGSVSVHFAF